MQTVTEKALLVYHLNQPASTSPLSVQLDRVVLVAMLHDVNDHKYDKDGSLGKVVESFVAETAQAFLNSLSSSSDDDSPSAASIAKLVMNTISAISYSKEKKRGMRWFEKELPGDWTLVRDAVSDADKLEAIGASGLVRSFEYNACVLHETGELAHMIAKNGTEGTRQAIAQNVVEHADDKLLHLKDEFIVTHAGKFLAQPRHDEMVLELAQWKIRGPPNLPHDLVSSTSS